MAIRWTRWLGEMAIIAAAVAALGPDRRKTTEPFEPPKYIASLIAAVNDGAKLAQASAILFLLKAAFTHQEMALIGEDRRRRRKAAG
jgi:hypothetical protein